MGNEQAPEELKKRLNTAMAKLQVQGAANRDRGDNNQANAIDNVICDHYE